MHHTHSTSRFKLPNSHFIQPDYTGHNTLNGPSFSFLIEPLSSSSKPILFDLGIRKDWKLLPSATKFQNLHWEISVEKDVAEILRENENKPKNIDIDGGDIASIIWSHHHWDHVGNAATFPSSTEIIVGPGFINAHLPGYPINPHSTLLESDFFDSKDKTKRRNIREVNIQTLGKGFQIGRFYAWDFFGNGSFYLLDTPGHAIGHICGLARTTSDPDSFVFMGGDAAHHGGEFRPTRYLPLPRELGPPSPLPRKQPVCPGELLRGIHPYEKANQPFYYVTESFAQDKKLADWTIEGLGELDAQENILMLMAHDDAIVDPGQLDFYPRSLNDWYRKGVKEKIKWLFLADFDEALAAKEKGGEPFKWVKDSSA